MLKRNHSVLILMMHLHHSTERWSKQPLFHLPAFSLNYMPSRSPGMNMWPAVWCTISGAQCYISTRVKTSLWRTFYLTGLIFRRQHLLLSTPLLGFLSPRWKIKRLISHLSLLAACHCFRLGLCGTKHLFIFSECLAQRKLPRAATPASPHS